jgi:tryptophan synthase beta chain
MDLARRPWTRCRMPVSLTSLPDGAGRFGPYGGTYVPETLIAALEQLGTEYEQARSDPALQAEFSRYLKACVNRPSPLYFAERLTAEAGGANCLP